MKVLVVKNGTFRVNFEGKNGSGSWNIRRVFLHLKTSLNRKIWTQKWRIWPLSHKRKKKAQTVISGVCTLKMTPDGTLFSDSVFLYPYLVNMVKLPFVTISKNFHSSQRWYFYYNGSVSKSQTLICKCLHGWYILRVQDFREDINWRVAEQERSQWLSTTADIVKYGLRK